MHIKLLYRKVLYVFLSLVIVIAPTIQQANAASSWSITGATSAGARSIVNATKAGFKSAVNIMPTGARFGLRLIRVGNTAALLYAAAQIANDGIDFVLDEENNTIKYKVRPDFNVLYKVNLPEVTTYHSTKESACRAALSAVNAGSEYVYTYVGVYSNNSCQYSNPLVGNRYIALVGKDQPLVDKVMPVSTAANQILKNAQNGDSAAQALARETAVEMVVSGDFDADLLSGAVPTSDTRPLVPAVPGNGNGNVTHGSDVGTGEGGMSGATPGEQSDAAKAAADAAKKAADAAKDAAKAAAEAASKAADDAEDLVNSGADAAEKAAADAAAKAAAQAAKDAAAAAAAAGDRAAATAAAAERAAAAATAAAKAAAEKAAKDLADAIAAGEQAAIDAAKAATEAAAKELAEAKEKQAAAEKAADRAKAEAAKPFELPSFCTWASVVCDYTVWVKEEYGKAKDWVKRSPDDTPAELMPIDDDPSGIGNIFQEKAEAGYVSFESQCPADVLIPVDLMGASQTLTISYTPFCHFASLIRYAVILGAWISGLLIVTGGRSRE